MISDGTTRRGDSGEPGRVEQAAGPNQHGLRQFRIELSEIRPKVWRTVLVPLDISLYKFSRIIQEAVGWSGYHLFEFRVKGLTIAEPDPEYPREIVPARWVKLWQVVASAPRGFAYEYDFGDSWEHEVIVQGAVAPVENARYPLCTGGARACPPEDCGGVGGYAEFLEAIKDPSHPDHEDMLSWAGGSFDPEEFSVEEVNRRFKAARLTRILWRSDQRPR